MENIYGKYSSQIIFNTSSKYMKKTIIFLFAFLTVIISGCTQEKPEEPILPLELDGTWKLFSGIGEPMIIDIISGNGGYEIVPEECAYFNAAGEFFTFTVSEDYVKAHIEGNKIILEMVKLFGDIHIGTYLVTDSSGQEVRLTVCDPGLLGIPGA